MATYRIRFIVTRAAAALTAVGLTTGVARADGASLLVRMEAQDTGINAALHAQAHDLNDWLATRDISVLDGLEAQGSSVGAALETQQVPVNWFLEQ